jgi:hypothetical protein
MKLSEQAAHRVTAGGIRMVRLIIPRMSDRALARLLRVGERVVYILTGNDELTASIAEVAEIFESGPPLSSTVRKIAASMDTDAELAASILACLRKPSPYGSDQA